MDIQIFSDLFSLGLTPIPIVWDEKTKQANIHPDHGNQGKEIQMQDISTWLQNMSGANGIALKLLSPFGMLDFDQKNSNKKNIYHEWLEFIKANDEDILRKVCIETTRNGGHHVYIKYSKLSHKIPVARSEGKEVISVYTGGLLSYCYPTPGYELIYNEFSDIEELTPDQFDIIITAASYFNEDTDHTPGSSTVALIDYPVEYENICLQFDHYCTDKIFEQLLNSIDLFEVKNKKYSNKKYHAYLRKGSTADYSAKAYFQSHRLLIFSGSYSLFPTWHDRTAEGDTRWVLSPSRIIFYRENRYWNKTIECIEEICKEHGIELQKQAPKEISSSVKDRSLFPYDVFPEAIQQYIFAQVIQHEYIAGAVLGSISAAIGNTTYLEAMQDYKVKPVLYIAIVAPPGAAKTPAVKKAFAPLEEMDNHSYAAYKLQEEEFNKDLAVYEKDKKKGEKPKPPAFHQILIKDSTIEMVSHILQTNTNGCCILADELAGFLNRFNQYKTGDEEQKWLELWSGNSILNQRVTTGVKKVQDPFCSILGGIQPGVLETMARDDRSANGFSHRFLFVYPKPQDKMDWQQIQVPGNIINGFRDTFTTLLSFRQQDRSFYTLSQEANSLYQLWFRKKNAKYNKTYDDNAKGIIAKYQEYCLRFALIIQVLEDGQQRKYLVGAAAMERAIRLMEYFFANMIKAGRLLHPETPLDKLSDQHRKLYDDLTQTFSTKTFVTIACDFGLKSSAAKMFLIRNEGKLFTKLGKGEYEKML